MNHEQIKTAIQAFIAANTSLESAKVIEANQNAPRPERPYATYLVATKTQQEWANESAVDNSGNINIENEVQIVASIQCFGENSNSILEGLRNSLNKVSIKDSLRGDGIPYIRTLNGVNDLTQAVATEFEERAGLDLEFRTISQVTDSVGLIETVEGTGTYDSGKNEFNINYNIGV